jgi:hypothetical protein
MEEKVSFNLRTLGIKAKTKGEIYRILTVEGHLYLPPEKETSIDFIREIIKGDKLVSHIYIY